MTDFQKILLDLTKNLSTLRERKAKQGDDAPLKLLHQIRDHREAIELTEQVIAGQVNEDDWRDDMKPLLVDIRDRNEEHPQWGVSIGDVVGGIINSKIAGRDIIEIGEVTLNLVPIETALGQQVPQHNLKALRQTLQQALPHLDAAQLAATRAAIEQVEQQIAGLPEHEHAYLKRVRDRYASNPRYRVESSTFVLHLKKIKV